MMGVGLPLYILLRIRTILSEAKDLARSASSGRFEKSIAFLSGHGVTMPNRHRDEREKAMSEGRHAGASERLFESLPELAKHRARSNRRGLDVKLPEYLQ